MRTLLFHDGALGDVLLSLPCITSIGRHAAVLHAVCRDDVGRLFRCSGVIHGSFSSDSSAFLSVYAGRPDRAARELLGGYDRAYVFTCIEGAGLATSIAGIVPDTRVITTVPPAGERVPVSVFRLQQVQETERSDVPVVLDVPPAVRKEAREVLARAGCGQRDVIVLHPGSGGKDKRWPLERYLALAERLAAANGAFVLFLSGPAEALPIRERIDHLVHGRKTMAHVADADLVLVAGLLAESGLFIGNDSGISHLAAAVGGRVLTLFGPTDPVLWRPHGETVQVIAAAALEDITVDAVLAAAGKERALQGTFL